MAKPLAITQRAAIARTAGTDPAGLSEDVKKATLAQLRELVQKVAKQNGVVLLDSAARQFLNNHSRLLVNRGSRVRVYKSAVLSCLDGLDGTILFGLEDVAPNVVSNLRALAAISETESGR